MLLSKDQHFKGVTHCRCELGVEIPETLVIVPWIRPQRALVLSNTVVDGDNQVHHLIMLLVKVECFSALGTLTVISGQLCILT